MSTIPSALILETNRVLLRPVDKNDYDEFLRLTAEDTDMWYYFSVNLGDPLQLRKWMETIFEEKSARTRHPFSIVDKRNQRIAGSMSLLNISYHDRRTEIGSSWLGKDFRATGINKHAKYAMLRFAFDELNFERVEFKTDVQNARARKGLENIGGIEEGILRSHMTMWNGRRRSSVYYSVLKNEWPALNQTIFKDIHDEHR